MTERRKKPRHPKHPLEDQAKLRTRERKVERRQSPRRAIEKERLTVQLSGIILNRLRNAVFWTPGMTITSFIERCIIHTVDRMEKDRGSAFPERSQPLRAGRPPR